MMLPQRYLIFANDVTMALELSSQLQAAVRKAERALSILGTGWRVVTATHAYPLPDNDLLEEWRDYRIVDDVAIDEIPAISEIELVFIADEVRILQDGVSLVTVPFKVFV